MRNHRTLHGETIAESSFTAHQRKMFERLFVWYDEGVDWAVFSSHARTLLSKSVPGADPTAHPLYVLSHDLEMRLGIAQEKVAPPDYRDVLVHEIEKKYGSRYRFCQDTGVQESFLSQVLNGTKNFSIARLQEVARHLNLGLALVPLSSFSDPHTSDDQAVRKVISIATSELVHLRAVYDHVTRIKTDSAVCAALLAERSLVPTPISPIVSEVERAAPSITKARVMELINNELVARESEIESLRRRLESARYSPAVSPTEARRALIE